MPKLSPTMEEGVLAKWTKKEGDKVSPGDLVAEVETDKANMVYESDQDGPLEIVAQEGGTLPIGSVIARIGGGGGAEPAAVAFDDKGSTFFAFFMLICARLVVPV